VLQVSAPRNWAERKAERSGIRRWQRVFQMSADAVAKSKEPTAAQQTTVSISTFYDAEEHPPTSLDADAELPSDGEVQKPRVLTRVTANQPSQETAAAQH
jgi:hypothetical protein